MNYTDLLNRVFNAFYDSGKDFPASLLLPILVKDLGGDVADMFMTCQVKRNDVGDIIDADLPDEFLINNVKSNEINFISLEPDTSQLNLAETRISQEKSISIGLEEFKKEYMAVRDFVFYNMLTSDETNSLRTVVSFYDKVSAPIIKGIYHAYAQDFFNWAYKKI